MDEPADPPPGFEPLFRSSPFSDLLGPFFYRRRDDGSFVVGVRVAQKHLNGRGLAHGGLIATLADMALGYRAAFSQAPPAALTTASLTTDFADSARLGDWLEVDVEVQRVGERLAFANAYISANGRRIVRASAVFARSAGSMERAE
jgi:acyl-coenzyme A thioesterase 13